MPIGNWHNFDIKVGDTVTLTLTAKVTQIDDHWLSLVDNCDIDGGIVDEFKVIERPSQWTDGDVVQTILTDVTWSRRNNLWTVGRDENNNFSDASVDDCVSRGIMRVLRQQSKEKNV